MESTFIITEHRKLGLFRSKDRRLR